jgi:hypothetical protein
MPCEGYVQHRLEDSPGNESTEATYNTKVIYPKWLTFSPDIGVAHLERDDEMSDTCEPLAVLSESKTPNWSAEGRMYPDVLGFLLSMQLGLPTTTDGDGVITDPDSVAIPAGAYRHVWTAPFNSASGASPQSGEARVAYEAQSVYYQLRGMGLQSLGITTPEQGGARLSASGPALSMTRISDPSLTPAYESVATPPFMHKNLSVSAISGGAVVEDFSLNIENPMDPQRTLGTASEFPDELYKGDGPIMVTGSIPKELLDDTDYDALVNATGFAATAKWISTAFITGSYPFGFWVEFDNAQYVGGGPRPLANQRRIGQDLDFKATYDGSGASTTITLVSATPSYT